jgi:hypothetical protein
MNALACSESTPRHLPQCQLDLDAAERQGAAKAAGVKAD